MLLIIFFVWSVFGFLSFIILNDEDIDMRYFRVMYKRRRYLMLFIHGPLVTIAYCSSNFLHKTGKKYYNSFNKWLDEGEK